MRLKSASQCRIGLFLGGLELLECALRLDSNRAMRVFDGMLRDGRRLHYLMYRTVFVFSGTPLES